MATKHKRTPCKACNKTGKQTIQVSEIGKPEQDVAITCIWCNGKGWQSEHENTMQLSFAAMWCRCGAHHGVYYFQSVNGHGWRCKDCRKVVQLG